MPRGRPKKVEVKKIGDIEKDGGKNLKNGEILGNGMNGCGETEAEPAEAVAGSDVSANDKVASKRRQKPAKTQGKEESVVNDAEEKGIDLKEDEPKDLPPKRGKKAANGNKEEETKTVDETEELPPKQGRKAASGNKEEETKTVDETEDLPPKRGRKAANGNKEEEKKTVDETEDLPTKRNRKAAKMANGTKEDETKTVDETKDLPLKRGRKAAKMVNETKEDETKTVDENKDLPPKRGRKAAKMANETKEDETKTVDETKDLPRSRRNEKANVESTNTVKEESQPKPKETKTKANKKAKIQIEENSEKKEVLTKGAGRKRKNIAEKSEPVKTEGEKSPELDENRQLRVALQRDQKLDKMAMQQIENEDEDFEEPKVKNVKGPAKGKGKRAAKDTSEDSKPIKKAKEDSKSKGASKKEKEKIPDVTALDFSNDSKTKDGKLWNFKIATWNVNGLRAWQEKNGLSYLHHEKPDIMCIQETKCSDDKLPPELANIDGYHCHWLAGDKEGYSGVGLLSKEKPISVQDGIGIEEHDNEGRVITAEYDEFYLVTSYIPNSGRGLVRLDYRQKWDKDFQAFIKKLDKKKPVVLCGDLNVAHEEIDLANPKSNKKTAGFTREEREGFSTLLSEGFVDSFRLLYPDEKGAYTFWTYMANARAKNVGWRLDYYVISERFVDHLCDSVIRKDVYGSDHCPIALFLHV